VTGSQARTTVGAIALAGVLGCGSDHGVTTHAAPATAPALRAPQVHSSSLAASPDGSLLFVVHPDADSVRDRKSVV
jgi:hypothetical protein